MKTINVHVIPNARKPSINMENNIFKVKVTAPAVDGKADSEPLACGASKKTHAYI